MDTKALVTQIVSQLEPYIVSAIVAALERWERQFITP